MIRQEFWACSEAMSSGLWRNSGLMWRLIDEV